MTLREELCLYIKSKNITQKDFSSSIGISEGYASSILSGRLEPNERLKRKIFKVCGCGKAEKDSVKYNHCYGCFYRRLMSGVGTTVYACHYMIDTGKKEALPRKSAISMRVPHTSKRKKA